MIRTFILAVLAFWLPQAVLADAGSDFIAKVSGRWTGAGSIRTAAAEPPAATRCTLQASGGGPTLSITGSCDGAARGANLAVSLTWVAATQQFTGTFSGAAESGTANLYGRLNGSTLNLNVTSANGGRSTMTLALNGTSARLAVSGRAGGRVVQFVTLNLSKG